MHRHILNTLKDKEKLNIYTLDRSFRYVYFTLEHERYMYERYGAKISEEYSILSTLHTDKERGEEKRCYSEVLRGYTLRMCELFDREEGRYYEKSYTPVHDGEKVAGICVAIKTKVSNLPMRGRLSHDDPCRQDITKNFELKKLSPIKELARGLTHEINTVLTSLRGHAQLLRMDTELIDDISLQQDIEQTIDSIDTGTGQLARIADTLHYLNVSSTFRHERFDVIKSIREILRAFMPKIKELEIILSVNDKIFHTELRDELYYFGEKGAVEHIIYILIDNAIDALSQSSGKRVMQILTKDKKGSMELSVIDNGGGISPSKVKKMFKPLTGEKPFGGLGLGLFVADNLAQMHGGRLVYSSVKRGSRFTLFLKKGLSNETQQESHRIGMQKSSNTLCGGRP